MEALGRDKLAGSGALKALEAADFSLLERY